MMKLSFQFDQPDRGNQAAVNQALSGLRIAQLDLKELEGCIATVTEYKENQTASVSYWYGILSVEMDIQTADDGDVYQIDTEVVAADNVQDDHYMDSWRSRHPGCIPRILQTMSYKDGALLAYIVLYHRS